jgi:hypothetical protein
MKSLPSFALVVSLTAGAAWTLAAPPPPQTGAREGRQISQAAPRQPLRVAQAEEPAPAAPKASGKDVLRQCRDKLAQYTAFKADIVTRASVPQQSATVTDRTITASGSYLQGKGLQLRLEFQVELAGTKGSLLQICDGQILWSQHNVAELVSITRRDVKAILDAARAANAPQAALITDIGLGGLNGMLASIENSMDLKNVGSETIDDRTVTLLEGTWTKAYKDLWKGQEFPPFMPDQVRVYIDQEQHYPRRIVYSKEASKGKPGRPVLVLDFTSVSVNAAVKDDDFLFVPPDTPAPVDITKNYVSRFQQAQPNQPQGPPAGRGAPAGKAAPKAK